MIKRVFKLFILCLVVIVFNQNICAFSSNYRMFLKTDVVEENITTLYLVIIAISLIIMGVHLYRIFKRK